MKALKAIIIVLIILVVVAAIGWAVVSFALNGGGNKAFFIQNDANIMAQIDGFREKLNSTNSATVTFTDKSTDYVPASVNEQGRVSAWSTVKTDVTATLKIAVTREGSGDTATVNYVIGAVVNGTYSKGNVNDRFENIVAYYSAGEWYVMENNVKTPKSTLGANGYDLTKLSAVAEFMVKDADIIEITPAFIWACNTSCVLPYVSFNPFKFGLTVKLAARQAVTDYKVEAEIKYTSDALSGAPLKLVYATDTFFAGTTEQGEAARPDATSEISYTFNSFDAVDVTIPE